MLAGGAREYEQKEAVRAHRVIEHLLQSLLYCLSGDGIKILFINIMQLCPSLRLLLTDYHLGSPTLPYP